MTDKAITGWRKAVHGMLRVTTTVIVCGGAVVAVIAGFSLITSGSDAALDTTAPRTTVGVMTV
jgi:hypothetical protein